MTDKKIVSLQAVPKQAKPVEEEKKYKVSDEAIRVGGFCFSCCYEYAMG